MTMAERHLMSARRAAELIRAELVKGDLDFAYRTLMQALSHLRAATTSDEIMDFMVQPPSTGDRKWDTFLAAATGYECVSLSLNRPSWTDPEPLDEEWYPSTFEPSDAWVARIRKSKSEFMAQYNILIRDRDFTIL
jgi:hypothetical protein